jgi:hypothetical protein
VKKKRGGNKMNKKEGLEKSKAVENADSRRYERKRKT